MSAACVRDNVKVVGKGGCKIVERVRVVAETVNENQRWPRTAPIEIV